MLYKNRSERGVWKNDAQPECVKKILNTDKKKYQIASEGDWMKTIQLSVKIYIKKVKFYSGSF